MLEIKKSKIEKFSPAWLENQINIIRENLISKTSNFLENKQIILILFCILIPLSIFIFKEDLTVLFFDSKFQSRYHKNWIQLKFYLFLYLVMALPILWHLKDQSEKFLLAIANSIVLLFILTEFQNIQIVFSILLIQLPLVLISYISSRWAQSRLQFSSIYLVLLIMLFISIFNYFIFKTNLPELLSLYFISPFGRVFLPLTVLMTEIRFYKLSNKDLKQTLWLYVFNPLFYLTYNPLKMSQRKFEPQNFQIRFRGLLDIHSAFWSFVAVSLIFRIKNEIPISYSHFLVNGFFTSQIYFFSSFAVFRMGSGIGRILGYNLPDNTNFTVLATNPLDSWRRWSTYLYDWMNYFIYLPLKKNIKFDFPSILLTFFALFLMHFVLQLPAFFIGDLNIYNEKEWLSKNLVFFLAQGLLVYFSIITQKLWPNSSTKWGWIGVITTQLFLALTHSLLNV